MTTVAPQRLFEEKRLFRAYGVTGDPRLRERLVTRYLPLARSLARRYARGGEPVDDLEQVASLALVKAIDSFDVERGTAFSTYAVPSIAGAIKRHYRDLGWFVRPPRDLQELAVKVVRVNEELLGETGHPATPAEIAERLHVSVEAVVEAREAYRQALRCDSLDRPRKDRHGREGEALLDTIGGPDRELDRVRDRLTLDTLLDELTDRDRLVVQLYYRDELTQTEIGERLGYSQMHISRILRTAVKALARTAAAPAPRRLASGRWS
jgi:RNA polymerase sigma-B factor